MVSLGLDFFIRSRNRDTVEGVSDRPARISPLAPIPPEHPAPIKRAG